MSGSTRVAAAFVALAAISPLHAEDDISVFLAQSVKPVEVRGAVVCRSGENAADLLMFRTLREKNPDSATELLPVAAFANGAQMAVCLSSALKGKSSPAILFIGTTTDQPRAVLVNPDLSPARREETVMVAVKAARELFANNAADTAPLEGESKALTQKLDNLEIGDLEYLDQHTRLDGQLRHINARLSEPQTVDIVWTGEGTVHLQQVASLGPTPVPGFATAFNGVEKFYMAATNPVPEGALYVTQTSRLMPPSHPCLEALTKVSRNNQALRLF